MIYNELINIIDEKIAPDLCFDVIKREIKTIDSNATYYAIDGLIDSDVLERVLLFLIKSEKLSDIENTIPYIETKSECNPDKIVRAIINGGLAVLTPDKNEAVIVFAKKYPARSIDESENEKTLRGPRDSFTEKILTNTSLIRRRIKSNYLRVEKYTLSEINQSDVALVYLENKVSKKLLNSVKLKLQNFNLPSLSFGVQSLAEYLIKSCWLNPFPKVRYTERPDCACAMITEGSLIIVCDNTPSVIILPTSIFDFNHEANDFYLPPVSSTYLRFVRLIISVFTVILMPTWYLLVKNSYLIPTWLSVIAVHEKEYAVPIIIQILIVEFLIDGLKLASLNTPDSLGNSLSVVTGLILGDMAVNIGWFVPEVILYMAFVSIANFSQASYEMGYALKFMRIIILLLTAFLNIVGFIIGIITVILLIAFNKTVDGQRSYLYPLIPWNINAIKRFFFRTRLEKPKRTK